MNIRAFVVALLLVAGLLPLVLYGYLSIQESKIATLSEAKRTNLLLSKSAADRVSEYLEYEKRQLITAGTGMLLSPSKQAHHMGEAFLLSFPHWHNLTVLGSNGDLVVKVPSAGYQEPAVDFAPALSGKEVISNVRDADAGRDGPFAHSMSLALPLYIVGALRGAIVVDIDLISVWQPINAIRVGKRGFVRLVTADGTVLAHGHTADRKDVFAGQKRPDLLAKAKGSETITNSLGETAITALSPVEGTDWSVIVEQPKSEALEAARAMRSNLIILMALTALFGVIVGLVATRQLVRGLETVEAHTKTLAAGDLSASVEEDSSIKEMANLAVSINTMAKSLGTLHSEARSKERITTFGRVAAGLAHDLRLPIETIQDAVKTLLENPDDESAREYFAWTAENELPRLHGYVEDLKRLADEGSVGLHRTKVDVASLLADVVETMSTLPKWEGIRFVVEGSVAAAHVDGSLLRRALSNLVANGADSMVQDGHGTVTMSISKEPNAAGDELVVRVSDNGHGMSEEALRDVLSGDFRSTKRANGVGLGFGVARHIVESHGGTISGSSVIDRGTTFEVRLPFLHSEDPGGDPA